MKLILSAGLLFVILILLTILIVVGTRVLSPQRIASDLKRDKYVAKYTEEAARLWREYAPQSGQASTVQGELIRDLQRLRDEAQRNGNLNWDEEFSHMAEYLESTLCGDNSFDATAKAEIRADVARLKQAKRAETDDQVYARLSDRVVEWCHAHPKPLKR